MTTAISKRQQARNERVLQELVSTVPGNNFCADCNAPNPSWASWSLGVFLCMRCGAIHRKLGTHISKVKSLSMDTWTAEQVENMRKVGNRASNKIYNPNNLKPSIPIDADEADSAMERFIRQKYTNNSNASSQIKGITRLEEDSPPPLPPKGSSKFGMRSASSIFPLGSKKKQVPAQSPIPSPRLDNKPSKVFGANVSGFDSSTEDMERKLAKLRDMGFIDNQRNTVVLKCVNGNLDRAVEALVRLGEDNSRGGLRPSRSLTPLSPNTPSRMGFSLNVEQPQTPASTTSSNNPFDALPALPQSSQSTGTIQNKNPYSNGTNPFGQPQGLSDFDQAFTNMTIAPTRPLFPNHTGGTTGQGAASMTGLYATNVPPVPPTPSQFLGMSYEQSGTYSQPATLSSQNTRYNLFLQQTSPAIQQSATFPQQPQMQNQQAAFQMQFQQQQQTQQQKGLPISTQQHTTTNNPFMRSPTRIQSPVLSQIPESQQPMFYTGQQPVASPAPVSTNPFFTAPAQSIAQPAQMAPHPAGMLQPVHSQTMPYGQQMFMGSSAQSQTPQFQQQQQSQQPQPQQQQQFQPQYMPKPSKENILALYNYPQLAPQPTGMPNAIPPAQPAQTQHMQIPSQQTHSFSTPIPGSKNPFASINTTAPNQIQMAAAVPNSAQVPSRPVGSRESIVLRGEMAWNNGRHSPDAFAALSSRQ